jgi:hypothetical protein
MGNGDPIIIKGGGSIEITLYKDTFPSTIGNAHRHYNSDRKITRVTITDDDTDETTECPIPDNGKFTIRIEHSL